MFNEFPYTSYEKINLDWLLDLGNKLKADAESGVFDGERGHGIFGISTIYSDNNQYYAFNPGGVTVGDFILGYSPAAGTNILYIMKVTSVTGNYVNGTSITRITGTQGEQGPQGEPGEGGLTEAMKQAFLRLARKVAYIDGNGQTYYNALYNAFYGSAPVVVLDSITAVFNQGTAVIYDTDDINTLKQYLVVTATYSDSSTATVPSTDYTLSGTLTAGTSVITVSYSGKTTTFNVTVNTAPSYVTNGLIHQWDAINNTRSGHNASVNVWEDLVGTNDLTVNNYSNITWLDNAVQFAGVNGTRFLGSEASTDATGKTVEVIFSVATARTEAICSLFHSTQYVNQAYGKIILYSDSTFGVKGQNDKTYANGVSDITNFHSISASYSAADAVQNVFANAQTATLGTATHSMSTSSANPSIGGSPTNYDYAFSGKVHAIRIYNRVLTAEEVAQNYAVDVSRYNLG